MSVLASLYTISLFETPHLVAGAYAKILNESGLLDCFTVFSILFDVFFHSGYQFCQSRRQPAWRINLDPHASAF